MIDRETLRNKILTNNDKFEVKDTVNSSGFIVRQAFVGDVDDVRVIIHKQGEVELEYDGVTETMNTFKNVYELLLKHKRDKIHATFGRLEP